MGLIFKKLKEMKVNESDIIEILENEKKYLRKKDLEDYEIYKNKVKENPNAFVIRIKGISNDLREVEEYLKKYMTPLLIRMRKDKKGKYTGTCFVELNSEA